MSASAETASSGSVSASAAKTSAIRCAWPVSSISVKAGVTPASSGNCRNSPAQKAWMVWIFSPPGVSIARAKRVRARPRSMPMRPPIAASASRSFGSGSIAHSPSRRNRRFCISPAAALV